MTADLVTIDLAVNADGVRQGIGDALQHLSDLPSLLQEDLEKISAGAVDASAQLKSLADPFADSSRRFQEDLAQETQQVEILASLHQISAEEAIAQRRRVEEERYAALHRELQAEFDAAAAIEKELSGRSDGVSAAKAAEAAKALKDIQDKSYVEEAKFNAEMRKLDLQRVKDAEASWKSIVAPITQSFGTAIQGIVAGTENLHQALGKIGQSIVGEFTKLAEKRVTDWLTSELAMTEATAAGNTARSGSDQAAATQSSGFSFTHALEEIEANAARVFSSVFAWAAPELGPFAVVPATAAAALVVAKEALIPSFDQGAWSLPTDMLAIVHQGETILPKPFADDYRSVVSGGRSDPGGTAGGDVHIHIHAIDAQSFEKQIVNAGSALVKSIHRQARLFNPRLRPA